MILLIYFVKIITFFLKLLGKGSSFPGKIALKLDSNILQKLAKRYKIILVTGTNGKTTTTNLIYNVMKTSGFSVISNRSGANMSYGIVACLVDNFSLRKRERYAVFEVDEAYARGVAQATSPVIFVVTNIFPDQLDRYGDVERTRKFIMDALGNAAGAMLILNADDILQSGSGLENTTLWYTLKENYGGNMPFSLCPVCGELVKYSSLVYATLGVWRCSRCENKHATLAGEKVFSGKVCKMTQDDIVLNAGSEFNVKLAGLYNIYNVLSAILCARTLNISDVDIQKGLDAAVSVAGRNEKVVVGGREFILNMIKNPVGANQVIHMLKFLEEPLDLALIINDSAGDGIDISWIWECDFEQFSEMDIRNVFVGGSRRYEVGIRLKTAGFSDIICCERLEQIVEDSRNKCIVLSSYTANTQIQAVLGGYK